MLKGTKTQIQKVGPNTTAIRLAQAVDGSVSDTGAITLDAVTVFGEKEDRTIFDMAKVSIPHWGSMTRQNFQRPHTVAKFASIRRFLMDQRMR
ncbi:MAG: hypothetical protein MPJ78_19275 [Hyphomicrobiaceae bacterium]|nr:hypothetical protein [Hyphomicrobiaceae bacterium]